MKGQRINCKFCTAWRHTSPDYVSPANRAKDARDWAELHESGRCSDDVAEEWRQVLGGEVPVIELGGGVTLDPLATRAEATEFVERVQRAGRGVATIADITYMAGGDAS
jgi:hypothetical protein